MKKLVLLLSILLSSVIITHAQTVCVVGRSLCSGNVNNTSGGGGYSTIQVNGVPTAQWPTVNLINGGGMSINCQSNSGLLRSDCTFTSSGGGGGGGSFTAITSGVNTSAVMVCGAGCTLTASAGGSVSANQLNGGNFIGVTGNLVAFAGLNTPIDSNVSVSSVVRAISPGTGIAHFPGLSQIVTSSLIVNEDITNATINLTTKVTGILPVSNGGSGVSTLTGIIKGNGTSPHTAATSADVITLWTGACNNGTFLRGDGACITPSGSGTVNSGTATHLAYYATTTSAVSDMGADFTFNTHTLAGGASAILDMHLAATAGLLLPGSLSTGLVTVTTSTGAVSSVTAPAGAVVGTTDSQTLTNKSIAGSEINSGLVLPTFGGTGADLHASVGFVRAGAPFTAGELTGDATTSVFAITLATVNAGPGVCGDAGHVCIVTTNGKGLVTTQSTAVISASAGGSNTQLQYNNSGGLNGLADFTFSTPHTVVVGASGILDLHSAATAGILLPGGLASGVLKVTTSTGAVSSATITTCGDATHAIGYDGTNFSCQAITGSSTAGGSPSQMQYNNSGGLGGVTDLTYNGTHTIALGAAGILDLHAAATAGFLLPGALSTGIVTVTTTTGAVSSVAAPAGAVVGTTDTQTLTNKSINGSEINSGLIGSTFGGTGADLHLSTGLVRSGNPFTSAELSGDATTSGSNIVTVTKVNGVSLAGLGTGILKNTTGTGVLSIAGVPDFPTLNQNTTGTASQITGLLTGANFPTLTLNAPVIGGGAGALPTTGSKSGNTVKFVTTTNALTTAGNILVWDASGNAIDGGPPNNSAFGAQGDFFAVSNGTTATFTPGWVFTGTQMLVFQNGLKQRASGNDYTVSGNTIVFSSIPVNGATIEVIQ